MVIQLNVSEGSADGESVHDVRAPTRRRILDAARRIVRRRGFAGLSMDGVAKQSGLARRTVYNHFDDRTTLFRELMLDLLLKLEDHIDVELLPDASLDAAIRRICAAALGVMRADEYDDVRTALSQDSALRPWLEQSFLRRIQRPLALVIEQQVGARVAKDEPGIDVRQFCAGMMTTLEAAAGKGGCDAKEAPFTVDEVANVVLSRLGPPVGTNVSPFPKLALRG